MEIIKESDKIDFANGFRSLRNDPDIPEGFSALDESEDCPF